MISTQRIKEERIKENEIMKIDTGKGKQKKYLNSNNIWANKCFLEPR